MCLKGFKEEAKPKPMTRTYSRGAIVRKPLPSAGGPQASHMDYRLTGVNPALKGEILKRLEEEEAKPKPREYATGLLPRIPPPVPKPLPKLLPKPVPWDLYGTKPLKECPPKPPQKCPLLKKKGLILEGDPITCFECFEKIFGKTYENEEIRQSRKKNFEKSVKEVVEQNKRYKEGKSTWSATIYEFADLSDDEFSSQKGGLIDDSHLAPKKSFGGIVSTDYVVC